MIFLWMALAGLACSFGFLALLTVAALRFRRLRLRREAAQTPPPVSVFKPLCGMEPMLEKNLEGFFLQDHPDYELVFGVRDRNDPALAVVERLRARHPQAQARVVFSGEPVCSNAKVCNLESMAAVARHDVWVISDSDVQVTPEYLRAVTLPMLDPQVGVVTCLYRGVDGGGLWSKLEALGMSVEMCGGVLTSALLAPMKFALGPSMTTRRSVIEKIGGFMKMSGYCADDFILGAWAARAGYKVALGRCVIGHVAMNRSFFSSMRHQMRWMRSTRFSLPAGHAVSVLSFAMPYGLLSFFLLLGLHRALLACGMLVVAVVNRMAMSVIGGWLGVGDPHALRRAWLYPLCDLMGFGFWCASYWGSTIEWRGARYRLRNEGRMEPCSTEGNEEDACDVVEAN